MSVSQLVAAAQRELRALKTATCEVRYAADDWAATAGRFACHYEMTPPKPGSPLDYDEGNGYGYTVWFDEAPEPLPETRDTVHVNGLTISIQKVPERGNLTPGFRIEGAVR